MKISFILDLPKTIIFNLHYFNFKTAVKLPVFVYRKTKFYSLKGKISIAGDIKRGMIRIGYPYVTIFDFNKSTIWELFGEIEFWGTAFIGHGSSISVSANGKLTIGDNFHISASSTIICQNVIEFKRDVLLSWQIIIMDTDFHKSINSGLLQNNSNGIMISEHVWIGMRTTILKGAYIPNSTVIASNSVIAGKKFKDYNSNLLIGGNPAIVLKENYNWQR